MLLLKYRVNVYYGKLSSHVDAEVDPDIISRQYKKGTLQHAFMVARLQAGCPLQRRDLVEVNASRDDSHFWCHL